MNIGLIADRYGVPAMFELHPGSIADVKTLERTVERVHDLKEGRCTMVMDRGFGSASNLKYMIGNDLSFVILSKLGTKCVKTLLSMLVKSRHDPDLTMIHDGGAYTVIGSQVAVVAKNKKDDIEDGNDAREHKLITSDGPRFADAPEGQRTVHTHATIPEGPRRNGTIPI